VYVLRYDEDYNYIGYVLLDTWFTDITSWTQESYDISAYAGENIIILFRFVSSPSNNYGGWCIDDVTITTAVSTLWHEIDYTPLVPATLGGYSSSPPHCWYCGNGISDGYDNNMNDVLVFPQIDLTDADTAMFHLLLTGKFDDSDGLYFEIYNPTTEILYIWIFPSGDYTAGWYTFYDDDNNGIDITVAGAGNVIQPRFRFYADNAITDLGVYIDDMSIDISGTSGAAQSLWHQRFPINPGHVVISEAYIDAINEPGGSEWIELHNPTSVPVDISGWTIDTDFDTDADVTLPVGATIVPGGYYLIAPLGFNSGGKDNLNWVDADYEEWFELANVGAGLTLRDSFDNIVDRLGHGNPAEIAGGYEGTPVSDALVTEGTSLERKSAQYHEDALGNGYDADDNSNDFYQKLTPEPQNTGSHPETVCFFCGNDGPPISYNNDMNDILVYSPPTFTTIPGNVILALTWWTWFNLGDTIDKIYVDLTATRGIFWEPWVAYPVSPTINSGGTWVEWYTVFQLNTDLSDGWFNFRFRLVTDSANTGMGVYVDDVKITHMPWQVVDTNFYSPDYSWWCGYGNNYLNESEAALELNASIDLSGTYDTAYLSFWHYYDIADLDDGGNVQISTNGGETWSLLTPIDGYPDDSITALDEPVANSPGYNGGSSGWVQALFDLLPYTGTGFDNIKIRFYFGSDSTDVSAGWFIDDIVIATNWRPSAPNLVTPFNNSRTIGNSQTLTWDPVTDLDIPGDTITYYWNISENDPTFSTIYAEGSTGATTSDTIITTDGQTYYWRVRAFDGTDYSDWSEIWNFLENTAPPAPTSPINPTNGSTVTTPTVILSWTAGGTDAEGDPITYYWYVGENYVPDETTYNYSGSTTTPSSTEFSVNNTATYYWRVRAHDTYEYSAWSPVWEFLVNLNTQPDVQDLSASASYVYRTDTIKITANGTDDITSESDLICELEYSPPGGGGWFPLEPWWNATGVYWQANFTPSTTAALGAYSFQVRFTDADGQSSNWYTANDLVTVLNNLPMISSDCDNFELTVNTSVNISLLEFGSDVEDLQSELVWDVDPMSVDTSLFTAVVLDNNTLNITAVPGGGTGSDDITLNLRDTDGGLTQKTDVTINVVPLPPPGLPDLWVWGSYPPSAVVGKPVFFYADIVRLNYDGAVVVEFDIRPVGGGSSSPPGFPANTTTDTDTAYLTDTYWVPTTEGYYELIVTIDPNNSIIESDETNNNMSFELKVIRLRYVSPSINFEPLHVILFISVVIIIKFAWERLERKFATKTIKRRNKKDRVGRCNS
jgi:hypothetical protein